MLVLSLLLIGFIFYMLAVVCDDFFVPAIDIMAKKMKLSSEASGATLLAIGSSAPEFFTALFAVLCFSGTGSDIGAGTIVGSAIFNVLVIIGVSAMFKTVYVKWQPVARDLAFYLLTIILLLLFFRDGRVTVFESGIFILVYIVYIFAVVNWRKLLTYKDDPAPEEDESEPKSGLRLRAFNVLSLFVPNPRKRTKNHVSAFFISVLIIAGLSWLLVDRAVFVGHALNINPTFLALTILAAGTSVPDLIGSIIVAKQGRGDMAVSNAIGSNIFDILIGLGIPWMLVMVFRGGTIPVSQENLIASVFLLLATVAAIVFLLIAQNFKIGKRSGLVLVFLYIGYCLYILQSAI